jgi:hypothetical protein
LNDEFYYMRSTELVVVTSKASVLLVGEGDAFVVHNTANSSQWSHLMQVLTNPTSGNAMQRATVLFPGRDVEMLERLVDEKFILEASKADKLVAVRDRIFTENRCFHFASREPVCSHLVVACTGSIVAGLIAPTLLILCCGTEIRYPRPD